jgi:hypothetical protein
MLLLALEVTVGLVHNGQTVRITLVVAVVT